MKIITGNTPEEHGMYIVYEDVYMRFPKKIMLIFVDGYWSYPSSDQKYRGMIVAYIGPIPSPTIQDLTGDVNVKYAIGIGPEKYINGPFNTLQEALNQIGSDGEFIFTLYAHNERTFCVRKWSDKKNKWLKRRIK